MKKKKNNTLDIGPIRDTINLTVAATKIEMIKSVYSKPYSDNVDRPPPHVKSVNCPFNEDKIS